MSHIPINAARAIAEKYSWDQVIVIARKVGEAGGEHCTTYGVDKENCKVAADIGDFLKHKVMGWKPVAGWQPIEIALKDEKADAILLANADGNYAVCTWYAPVEKWMFCQTGKTFVFFDGATHWMPLPKPPEDI